MLPFSKKKNRTIYFLLSAVTYNWKRKFYQIIIDKILGTFVAIGELFDEQWTNTLLSEDEFKK